MKIKIELCGLPGLSRAGRPLLHSAYVWLGAGAIAATRPPPWALQEYAVWVHLSWRTIPLRESLGEISPRSGPELGEFLPCEDGDYSTFILLWAS